MFDISNPKYRKAFKGRNKGLARSHFMLRRGNYGLKAITRARVTAKQLESAFRAISRRLKKRSVFLYINIFPAIPVSNKPTDVRMGKGKGAVAYHADRVKPGVIIFELFSVLPENHDLICEVLAMAAKMLPLQCKIVTSDSEVV